MGVTGTPDPGRATPGPRAEVQRGVCGERMRIAPARRAGVWRDPAGVSDAHLHHETAAPR
jgi:hypothetical protein